MAVGPHGVATRGPLAGWGAGSQSCLMASYLLVIGDREALGCILTAERMAFPSASRHEVAALDVGPGLVLYTTRGAYKIPTRGTGVRLRRARRTGGDPRRRGPRAAAP